MNAADVANFLERDWDLVHRMKASFWTERNAALTPTESLRLGDELWRYARAARSDWPNTTERRADLAVHTRISQALRHAATNSSD